MTYVKKVKEFYYKYKYDPVTKKEIYLGTAFPIAHRKKLEALSEAMQAQIVARWRADWSVANIKTYLKKQAGLDVSAATMYKYFAEKNIKRIHDN